MNKSILIVTLVVCSLLASSIIVAVSPAHSVPEPSVPKFSIQVQTQANTTTITLTIRNQPFDALILYPDGFFYNVAVSVDGKNWSELYHVEDAEDWYPQQSNGSTTVLTFVAGETRYYPRNTTQSLGVIPESGDVAFQVQAMIGHRDRGALQNGFMPYVFMGVTSGWSNAQTVTLTATSSSPFSSPTVPEFPATSLTIVILFIAIMASLILKRKQFRKS